MGKIMKFLLCLVQSWIQYVAFSFSKFCRSRTAKISIIGIVGLVLGVTVAAYMLPDAITAITNQTAYGATVPSSVKTLMTTVAGIVIAVIFIIVLYKGAVGGKGGN